VGGAKRADLHCRRRVDGWGETCRWEAAPFLSPFKTRERNGGSGRSSVPIPFQPKLLEKEKDPHGKFSKMHQEGRESHWILSYCVLARGLPLKFGKKKKVRRHMFANSFENGPSGKEPLLLQRGRRETITGTFTYILPATIKHLRPFQQLLQPSGPPTKKGRENTSRGGGHKQKSTNSPSLEIFGTR